MSIHEDDDEPPRVLFFVSRSGMGERLFATPVTVVRDDRSGWVTVRGLAGRYKNSVFSVVRHELHARPPRDAKLVSGGRAFVPAVCPEEKKAYALRKRLRQRLEEGTHWTQADRDRAFRAIDALAKTLYPKNPFDLAWSYYREFRERWLEKPPSNQDVRLLFYMLDVIQGAASRSAPCTGHSDCRAHPDLGAACTAAGTARRPS